MTTTFKTPFILALFFLLLGGSARLHSQIIINEMSAANLDQFLDNFGKHEDWIELHNITAADVSLEGWFLSDNMDKPTKWAISEAVIIPAGGYKLVYCSGRNAIINDTLHASFKITQTKNNAEVITLTNPQSVVVDFKKVKTIARHHSYGRKADGGSDWGICTLPTPGASNTNAPFYEDYAKPPVMDMAAGFYPSAITVTFSAVDSGIIRYNLVGNEPTLVSTKYETPLNVAATKVIKAKLFPADPTLLPSLTTFNTYFINETYTLPVVSISGNDLTALANGNQGLRPLGTLELFGTDKTRVARTTGELNSHGQDSWVNDQRSLDWISRDEMGVNATVNEVLFPGLTDRDEFQRFILRAAGDDNYPGGSDWPGNGAQPLAAHMRDAYTQNLAKKGNLHLDVRAGSKAIAFINGKYWGVYDLRELPDDHDYTDYNYSQGKYDIDYLLTWGGSWAEYASTSEAEAFADWNNLVDFVKTNDMSDQTNFDAVKEQLDYKSLVDYMLVNSFSNASDWLNYNTGWWRGNNPDGGHKKWGYILWDLDATYAYYINYTGILDTSATAPPCNVEQIDLSNWAQFDPQPQNHLDLLNILQENEEFRQYWITRQADLSKSTFGCENMLAYFDEVVASIEPEMPKHIAKWGGSVNQWKNNVKRFRNFIERRCDYFSTGLVDCYNLTGPFNTVFIVDPPLSGSIQANSLVYNDLPVETPIFGNIGLRLEALPAGNNTFDRWESKQHTFTNPSAIINQLDLTVPDTIIAYFKGTSVPVVTPVAEQPDVVVFPTLVKESFSVDFTMPVSARVSIRLLDVAGKEMANIMAQGRNEISGSQRVFVHAATIPAGTYFLEFVTDKGFVETTKIVKR